MLNYLPHAFIRFSVLYSNIRTYMILMFCRYAVDLVVCVALGCDMFDCVFPTRTAVSPFDHTYIIYFSLNVFSCSLHKGIATLTVMFLYSQRFGSALVPWGSLQVKHKRYAKDLQPIDPDCHCPTCRR